MRTAIVSDLHLGSAFGEDLLREPSIRRTLIEGLTGAERLVLLGDAVETRELPLAQTLERVRPFFEELGEPMEGRQVILVPGNHDHRLAEPLLEREALAGHSLGLEHRAAPSGIAAEQIATWLGGAELQLAYPGIWLRDDVYATHGHYMDCHMSLPRLECVAAAGMMRAFGPLSENPGPADYERVLRPVYGFSFGLSQSNLARRAARPSERAWQTLSGRGGKRGWARRVAIRAAIATAVPAGVWSVNRLLRAEFSANLSASSISRSGIEAATELAVRLEVNATHVLTGHTHRAGPSEGEAEWELPGGGRLHNTGSWVFASAFHRPGIPPGPYWPGTVTWLDDAGPPRRINFLREYPREELQSIADRLRCSFSTL